MGYWEYKQSFGRNSARKVLVGCQKNLVRQKITYRQVKTLGKSCSSCRSVLHELTLNRLIVEWISSTFIVNPMDDRFVSRIVTCDEKWIYYRNPDASNQWLGPRQPAQVFVKKSVLPQSNMWLVEFWRCDSLWVCSKLACNRCESLFSRTGTSSRNFETAIPNIT